MVDGVILAPPFDHAVVAGALLKLVFDQHRGKMPVFCVLFKIELGQVGLAGLCRRITDVVGVILVTAAAVQ